MSQQYNKKPSPKRKQSPRRASPKRKASPHRASPKRKFSPHRASPTHATNRSMEERYCSCINKVKAKQRGKVNPWAVCSSSVGRKGRISCKKYE